MKYIGDGSIFEVQKIMDYVPFALFVLVIYLSYRVVQPFITGVVFALILAYIFSPFYKRLVKKFKKKSLIAAAMTVVIALIIAIPLVYFGNAVIKEANALYVHTTVALQENTLFSIECEGQSTIACQMSQRVNTLMSDRIIGQYIADVTQSVTQFFSQSATRLIVAIPKTLLESLMLLFMVFYFLRDSKLLAEKVDKYIPLTKGERKQIYLDVKNVIFGVIYGSIIVAIIQGAMGAIGFYLFGIRSPLFWGVVMAILALIPMIGASLIWGPASIALVLQGLVTDDSKLIVQGIFLVFYGLMFISSVENFLKPKIIGDHAKIHPVIILLGVLGGLKAFGIIGFFIGPLVLALLFTCMQIINRNAKFSHANR